MIIYTDYDLPFDYNLTYYFPNYNTIRLNDYEIERINNTYLID